MKKTNFNIILVGSLVISMFAVAKRGSDKAFCLNSSGTACDVEVPLLCLVDRGLGVNGVKQCAAARTTTPCPAVQTYKCL